MSMNRWLSCVYGVIFVALVYLLSVSSLLSAQTHVGNLIREIEKYASDHGHVPDGEALEAMVAPFLPHLSDSDVAAVSEAWVNAQKPRISKEHLAALYESKIAGISSFKIEYRLTGSIDDQSVIFIRDRSNFFADVTYTKGVMSGTDLARSVVAYNGDYLSAARYFSTTSRLTEGSIVNFTSLNEIIPFEHPMLYACLLPHDILSVVAGRTHFFLPGFLKGSQHAVPIIFEKTTAIEGTECVEVSNGTYTFFLNPEKNFSVVRIVERHQANMPPVLEVNLSDHIDCGNGIWFPKSIQARYSYGDSRFDRNVLITVSSVELNKEIDPKTFTDIFPEDVLVADLVRNLSYEWSERPSIDSTLDKAVKSKRVWIFQIISMTVGIILILIWIIIKYVKYRACLRVKNSE